MSIVRLPINIKSLYFNIKNDNKEGHTATVATPLKQGASVHEELMQIIMLPEGINTFSREALTSEILAKSRAQAKINGIYVFSNLSVNGVHINNDSAFCMYIREETDPNNVHFGRQKLHYPTSLVYEDEDININNKSVIRTISEHLHGYAFLVEAFEYYTETQTLNFDVTIVGENNIPYSKVFINKRGVGNKFTSLFTETSDVYDAEIISLREKYGYDVVGPDNFDEFMTQNTSLAFSLVVDYLVEKGAKNIRILKEEYPYSLFDIQYTDNGKRKYVIVKQTSTKEKYFNLPIAKIQFCNDFADNALLILATDINGSPKVHTYTIRELNALSKSIDSITYKDRK